MVQLMVQLMVTNQHPCSASSSTSPNLPWWTGNATYDAISGMSKTTMATRVGVCITEEEFKKEKDKEQGPTKVETADRIKSKLFHCEICES